MMNIVLLGAVLKVFQSVVACVAVDVVDDLLGRTNKRFQDKPMDSLVAPARHKQDALVTLAGRFLP